MSVDTPKNEGFNVPLDSATAALVERASGSMSLENKIQFILEIIKREMRAIIEEREKTTFTEEDWRMFFALRENPPEPTEAMKDAIEAYKALIENHADRNFRSQAT